MLSLEKLHSKLSNILSYMAISLLMFSTILVFLGVIGRYAFGVSFQWVEEISRYTVVYAVLLYVGPLIERNSHINMDFVFYKLPINAQRLLYIINSIIILVFSSYVLMEGISWVSQLFKVGIHTNSGLFMLWMPAIAVPIGFFIAIVYALITIIRGIRNY